MRNKTIKNWQKENWSPDRNICIDEVFSLWSKKLQSCRLLFFCLYDEMFRWIKLKSSVGYTHFHKSIMKDEVEDLSARKQTDVSCKKTAAKRIRSYSGAPKHWNGNRCRQAAWERKSGTRMFRLFGWTKLVMRKLLFNRSRWWRKLQY